MRLGKLPHDVDVGAGHQIGAPAGDLDDPGPVLGSAGEFEFIPGLIDGQMLFQLGRSAPRRVLPLDFGQPGAGCGDVPFGGKLPDGRLVHAGTYRLRVHQILGRLPVGIESLQPPYLRLDAIEIPLGRVIAQRRFIESPCGTVRLVESHGRGGERGEKSIGFLGMGQFSHEQADGSAKTNQSTFDHGHSPFSCAATFESRRSDAE